MSTITSNIDLAVRCLASNEIVAIPTETVYGLAGNAENETAIYKIYTLKNRPLTHPLIMHIGENWDLTRWVTSIPNCAKLLIRHFWPGPLTLVLPCNSHVNPLITAGQNTIALRCPKHPVIQAVLQQLGVPLVAPSANPFGKISPTTAEHVLQSFSKDELLILDGGRCQIGIESTIVAIFNDNNYQILRHGIITEQEIQSLLEIQPSPHTNSSLRVPGKLAHHYQPNKPLFYFSDPETLKSFYESFDKPIYLLSFANFPELANELCYQLKKNPQQTAFELYYQLRRADLSPASCIIMELPPKEVAWEGIRERIIKAGQSLHTPHFRRQD